MIVAIIEGSVFKYIYRRFLIVVTQSHYDSNRGFELQDMKKMLKMYKEWGFQMYPGLNFQDLLGKFQVFAYTFKILGLNTFSTLFLYLVIRIPHWNHKTMSCSY